jgi:hypothetical protein
MEGFGDFKIRGQIIHTVKYADDLVLLAKKEKVLQDMFDKLIKIGGLLWNGYKCGKNKSNEKFKTDIPSKHYGIPNPLEIVESVKYLGNILTNDGRCTCDIKCSFVAGNAALNRKHIGLKIV